MNQDTKKIITRQITDYMRQNYLGFGDGMRAPKRTWGWYNPVASLSGEAAAVGSAAAGTQQLLDYYYSKDQDPPAHLISAVKRRKLNPSRRVARIRRRAPFQTRFVNALISNRRYRRHPYRFQRRRVRRGRRVLRNY